MAKYDPTKVPTRPEQSQGGTEPIPAPQIVLRGGVDGGPPGYGWNSGNALSHNEMDDNWINLDISMQMGLNYPLFKGLWLKNKGLDTEAGIFVDNPYNNGVGIPFGTGYINYRLDELDSSSPAAYGVTLAEGDFLSHKGDLNLKNGNVKYGTTLGFVDSDTSISAMTLSGANLYVGAGSTTNPQNHQVRIGKNGGTSVAIGSLDNILNQTATLQLGAAGSVTSTSKSSFIQARQTEISPDGKWNLSLHSYNGTSNVEAVTIRPDGQVTIDDLVSAVVDFDTANIDNLTSDSAKIENLTSPGVVQLGTYASGQGGNSALLSGTTTVWGDFDVRGKYTKISTDIADIVNLTSDSAKIVNLTSPGVVQLGTEGSGVAGETVVWGDLVVKGNLEFPGSGTGVQTLSINNASIFPSSITTGGLLLTQNQNNGTVAVGISVDALNEIPLATEVTSWNDLVGTVPLLGTGTSAAKADQLTTARTLWGQSFNGTANVSGSLAGVTSVNAGANPLDLTSNSSVKLISATGGYRFKNTSNFYGNWNHNALTADRVFTMPDSSGTVALTSDIPTVSNLLPLNNTWTGTNTFNNTIIGNAATATNATKLNNATASVGNIANRIVQRNSSGNFSAGTITAALSGNATTCTTAANSSKLEGYQSSTSSNGSTIVRRAANGSFSAGTITAALSGNASSATKLFNAWNIGGVSFNGTKNIDLPGVNIGGNQNTTGSSASCTGNSATVTNGVYKTGTQTISGAKTFSSKVTISDATLEMTKVGQKYIKFNNTVSGGSARMQHDATDNGRFVFYPNLQQTNGSSLFATITADGSIGGTGGILMAGDISCGGDITAGGNVTAYSDLRLKKDIEIIPNALDKVSSVKGVTYTTIDGEERRTGVIAQDIREVLPEAVQEDENGTLSVAYGNIVGLLIEAIKELKEEVDELKR